MVSILTPSFQQGKFLEENIKSVLDQQYEPFEHVVVDGASTDNTIDVLKMYPHVHWVSENDNGQADALNKGLKLAVGDIIGWINADDFYEANTFHEVAKEFEDSSVAWVIGNITTMYEQTGKLVHERSPVVTYQRLIRDPDIVRQQGAFFRRTFLESVGGWNGDLYLAMDYDLWIRMAKVSVPRMIDRSWGVFRIQPNQKTSGRNAVRQLQEIVASLKREHAPHSTVLKICLRKCLYILKYYFKILLIRIHVIHVRFAHLPLLDRITNENP